MNTLTPSKTRTTSTVRAASPASTATTTVVEVREEAGGLTQRQRWGHYFAVLYGIVGLIIGLGLQANALNATVVYTNVQAGIRAEYPERWLLDTDGSASGDYLFRVRDMAQTGYKTTLQVSVLPVTLNTTARNLVDTLVINRSQTFSEFTAATPTETTIRSDISATEMRYTFAYSDQDPFLESRPTIVEGVDLLAIRGGQAIVITYLSDASVYEQNLPYYDQFVQSLQF